MLSAVSIDVDALRFYGAIHGLRHINPEDDPIYSIALPRFFELLEDAQIPGTVFFVGEDLNRAGSTLRTGLVSTASELASHSHSHDYRLGRRSRDHLMTDLRSAHEALRSAAPDGRVLGFRAPGYNTTPAMLEALLELGYQYDSSLLPAPAYFLARAAALTRYALRARASASLIGDLRAFCGPLGPYRTHPATPWRPEPRGPLVEIPMAVEPTTRLPLIGTSWILFPDPLRRAVLNRALRKAPSFVFEMHAIDLIDRTDRGVPPALADAQPDLRQPATRKVRAFLDLFRSLRKHCDVRTLRDIAATV